MLLNQIEYFHYIRPPEKSKHFTALTNPGNRIRIKAMTEITMRQKRLIEEKLASYGFTKEAAGYVLERSILQNQFRMKVQIAPDGRLFTELRDASSNEEYVLHLVSGTVGKFVAEVRQAHEAVLEDILAACYEKDIFQSVQAHRLVAYVRQKYGDELEYLWQKFPDNAVWRRKDNGKWYAAILTVQRNKLGLGGTSKIEIIDLRLPPEQMAATVDMVKYFPGWHMNKKNWYTVCLDGSVPDEELCQRLDQSYTIAKKS